jgi:hypothetical protein
MRSRASFVPDRRNGSALCHGSPFESPGPAKDRVPACHRGSATTATAPPYGRSVRVFTHRSFVHPGDFREAGDKTGIEGIRIFRRLGPVLCLLPAERGGVVSRHDSVLAKQPGPQLLLRCEARAWVAIHQRCRGENPPTTPLFERDRDCVGPSHRLSEIVSRTDRLLSAHHTRARVGTPTLGS